MIIREIRRNIRMDIKTFVISVVLSAILPEGVRSQYSKHMDPEAMELQGDHPIFLPTPTNYKAHVGQRITLECAVESLENFKVIWRKATDPNPLTVGTESFYTDERIVAKHIPKKNQWNLVIKRVRLTDSGVYECQISSRLRHLRHHVLLTVRETEVQTTQRHRPDIKVTGDAYVEQNGRIYLICNATGLEHPPDDLDWFLDGNKLPNKDDGRVIIRKDVSLTSRTIVSSLEIKEARHSDTGNYVCRTSNMQIENLMVTVLNADTINVKRGTIPGKSDKPGSKKTDRQTGSLKDGGRSGGGDNRANPTYRRTDTGGHNSASSWLRDSGLHFRLFVVSMSVIVISSHYSMFPS